MKNIVITTNVLLLFMFFVYVIENVTVEDFSLSDYYEGAVYLALLDLLILVVPILTLKYIVGLEKK